MQYKAHFWGLGLVALLLATNIQAAIYADFTTAQGSFSVELDVMRAPRAVANFIGLTDGTQTWRDPVTGAVRGGSAGDGFYKGMQFYSTAGSLALLGGMRRYIGSDGGEYWEGAGYTILDEVGNGVDLVRGVLAVPEFEGPHSGGGEFAVLLTAASNNVGSGWTGFGAVTGAGMTVVTAIANEVTNGSGRVAAQVSIRDSGITPEETAALAMGLAELPVVSTMPLGFGQAGHASSQAVFWSAPKSQACLATASNLLQTNWSVLPGTWNTDTNAAWQEVPLASIPGLATQRGFLNGSEAIYPKMTAEPFAGKVRFGMAHTGLDMQYWLDFDGGTGVWAQVEGGAPVQSGNITEIGQMLQSAHSVHIAFFIGWTAYHYWLGFDEVGALEGRFYCEQWLYNAELTGTDSGSFEWAAGWGRQSFPNAWKPVSRFDVRAPSQALLSMEAWEAWRTFKRRLPVLNVHGLDLKSE